VAGFLEPLGDWPGPDKVYRTAKVIGTGGAAAAISFALKQRRFLLITIGQTLVSATLFQQRHGDHDPDFVRVLADYATPPDPSWQWTHQDVAADLLVNATPLGMAGQAPLAFDLANLAPAAIVYDLVTEPVETDLIRRARAGGHRVITGIEMLIAQAAEAFTLLFGFEAPREHDEELMERLTS
jgi:shikimate dehydrogenase